MKERVEKQISALEAEQERLRAEFARNHVKLEALKGVLKEENPKAEPKESSRKKKAE